MPMTLNLHDYFEYRDGKLLWKVRPGIRSTVRVGDSAGTHRADGYTQVGLKGVKYLRHRLVWELHNEKIPEGFYVDHINGNIQDDRIENLRLSSVAENNCNRKTPTNNTSGFKGVFKCGKKWRSEISFQNKKRHLGYFNSPEEAYKAYLKTAGDLHKCFSRHLSENTQSDVSKGSIDGSKSD